MHGIVDGVPQTATINGGDGTCAGYTATLQAYNCSGPSNVIHTSFPAGSQEFFIQTVFTTTGSSNDLMFYLQSDELFAINLNQSCSTPSAIAGTSLWSAVCSALPPSTTALQLFGNNQSLPLQPYFQPTATAVVVALEILPLPSLNLGERRTRGAHGVCMVRAFSMCADDIFFPLVLFSAPTPPPPW